MKVNVSKEQLLKAAGEPYLQATLPDFITLEGEPLQDNGTVEKTRNTNCECTTNLNLSTCSDHWHLSLKAESTVEKCCGYHTGKPTLGTCNCPCHRKEETHRCGCCVLGCTKIHKPECPKAAPTIKDIEEVRLAFAAIEGKINELMKGFNTLKNRI